MSPAFYAQNTMKKNGFAWAIPKQRHRRLPADKGTLKEQKEGEGAGTGYRAPPASTTHIWPDPGRAFSPWESSLALTHLCLPPAEKVRVQCWSILQRAHVRTTNLQVRTTTPPGSPGLMLRAGQQKNIKNKGITGNPTPCCFLIPRAPPSVSSPWI